MAVPLTLNLQADAGKQVLFSGNTATINGLAQKSGIGFGRYYDSSTSSWNDSQNNAALNVLGAGQVILQDPVTVDMNNGKTFAFVKANPGLLYLGGDNNWNAAGGSTLTASAGTVGLAPDFSLRSGLGNPLNVNLGAITLSPELSGRAPSLAMFNNPNAMDVNGTAVTATYLGFAELNNTAYLMVSGANAPAPNAFTLLNNPDSFLELTLSGGSGANLYLQASNPGLTRWLGQYPNILSNRAGLDYVFQGAMQNLPLDQQLGFYQHVLGNIRTLSQEANVTQGLLAFNTYGGMVQNAWATYQASRLEYAPLAALEGAEVLSAAPSTPLHMWAGYIGGNSRASDMDNYQGYHSRLNGLLVGVSYDFTPDIMAGLYMGYGNGRTVYDSLNAEVDSDVWQAGLMGQWRKEALTLRGDVNYAHITNDSARHTPVPEGWAGNYGDYKQQVMGAGLRAGYDVTPWTNGLLTPYLELRYQHLKQDGFSESGGMWAMRLDSVNADSFTSALGVELKHTVYGANGISMTPSLNVAWVHEFGDDSITSQNAFVNAPGWYDVSSVSTDRDRARIDLGLSLGMLEDNRLSLNLGYQAEVGAESFSHTYFGGLQLKF